MMMKVILISISMLALVGCESEKPPMFTEAEQRAFFDEMDRETAVVGKFQSPEWYDFLDRCKKGNASETELAQWKAVLKAEDQKLAAEQAEIEARVRSEVIAAHTKEKKRKEYAGFTTEERIRKSFIRFVPNDEFQPAYDESEELIQSQQYEIARMNKELAERREAFEEQQEALQRERDAHYRIEGDILYKNHVPYASKELTGQFVPYFSE